MWFFTIFVGFIASFYLGCWVLYKGVKKIVERDSIPHAVLLILLAAGLLILCHLCFKGWYSKMN
jgi:hypothetical protein